MIEGLRALGVTVFLTTHYMDEAEHLADRVVVIAGGRIVAEGPPADACRPRCGACRDPLLASRRALRSTTCPARCGRRLPPARGWAAPGHNTVPDIGARAADGVGRRAGLGPSDLEVRRPTLEDIYLELTDAGQTARVSRHDRTPERPPVPL